MSAPVVLFSFGRFTVHLFGVTIALGFLAGTWVALKLAQRKGIDQDKAFDLILYLLLGGLGGSRLLYVLLNIREFLPDPLSIFSIHEGGLAFHGAVIAGIVIALAYTRRHGISFLDLADSFAPGLILGYAVGRLGCDIYGNATTVPWAVTIFGVPRHPVQYYSAAAGFVIFALLLKVSASQRFRGEVFLAFITGYSAYRFAIEFFRSSGTLPTQAQYASIIIMLAGLIAMLSRYRKPAHAGGS